jgi:protein-tyrosine-phosphatase
MSFSGDQEKPMKVLFICYANVGRSQVAEACFKTLSQHDSHSAGIALNERIAQMKLPSKKLKHAAIQHSVEYIKREFGIDIGEKERQQLVPEMMDTADLAIAGVGSWRHCSWSLPVSGMARGCLTSDAARARCQRL